MEQPLVLLGSLLLVSFCSGHDFCRENNCPNFTSVEKTNDYEERLYEATDWITTEVEHNNLFAAHLKLKDYCQRQKEAGYTLPVDTWPVLITENTNGNYLSWFVPSGTRKPETPDALVTLQTRPAGTVYVRLFGGTPSLEKGEENKASLRKALDEAGKEYDHNSYSGAGYEPFLNPIHHNEIWINAANIN
ncbi:heme-binding protein 2-like [Labrus bergylta]|uniref:Heme-binding protein soul2 n=1 Tax=Labrus bergylta TaxID=56723 RepID=A0A3Q3EW97_9LABR